MPEPKRWQLNKMLLMLQQENIATFRQHHILSLFWLLHYFRLKFCCFQFFFLLLSSLETSPTFPLPQPPSPPPLPLSPLNGFLSRPCQGQALFLIFRPDWHQAPRAFYSADPWKNQTVQYCKYNIDCGKAPGPPCLQLSRYPEKSDYKYNIGFRLTPGAPCLRHQALRAFYSADLWKSIRLLRL
jgi:hypothetical protein